MQRAPILVVAIHSLLLASMFLASTTPASTAPASTAPASTTPASTTLTWTALAQDDSGDLEIRSPDDPRVTILPRPSSGTGPETPGDPGGWQQLTLLAVIVVALVVIFLIARRQARKARARADV